MIILYKSQHQDMNNKMIKVTFFKNHFPGIIHDENITSGLQEFFHAKVQVVSHTMYW